ncbi:Insulin-like growth factor-binding protein 5, partial [Gavia stellata]
ERESREHEEPTTSEMTEETYPPKAYRPKHGRLSELKAEALKKDRRKKLTLAKFVGMAENTAHPRVVIPELRQEFELVGLMLIPSVREPRGVWWPTPDLCPWVSPQCKPSRGRKRGLCWCVDKYGMKLPGTDYLSGDLQCHAFDSSNVE